MSPKAIGTMLKIWSRFSQAGQAAVRAVEILDSQFGSRHCMAWTTNLDFICQRTSCRKTSSIQNALLVWCLECLLEDVGCKRFPPDLNQPSLKIVVSRYLLKKRVLTYIARKFPALDEAGRSYDTRFHPSKVLDNVFSTVAAWKESGLSSTCPQTSVGCSSCLNTSSSSFNLVRSCFGALQIWTESWMPHLTATR